MDQESYLGLELENLIFQDLMCNDGNRVTTSNLTSRRADVIASII